MTTTSNEHKLYAIQNQNGKYLAGFDTIAKAPILVEDPLNAKMFTNKYEVRLRPTETIVEITVKLTAENTTISEPFRPRLRQKDLEKNQAHTTV